MRELLVKAVILIVLLAPCSPTPAPPPPSPIPPSPPPALVCGVQGAIPWDRAYDHAGEYAVVYGRVESTRFASGSRGQPTFLNIGKPHPDPDRFTALIWGEDRQKFVGRFGPPEDVFLYADVCVQGLVEIYEGVPEIILRDPGQIWLQ